MNIPIKVINKDSGQVVDTKVSARKLLEVSDEADLLQELTLCDCKPVGETNVVDCDCEVYWDDFEMLIGDEIKEMPFLSNRGIPLITQRITEGRKTLTAEKYAKWEALYLINEDGTVEEVKQNKYHDMGWRNNCIDPDSFIAMAGFLNATYDGRAYNHVLHRYRNTTQWGEK